MSCLCKVGALNPQCPHATSLEITQWHVRLKIAKDEMER